MGTIVVVVMVMATVSGHLMVFVTVMHMAAVILRMMKMMMMVHGFEDR